MFSSVTTSSAMIRAYTSATSSWRRRNRPCIRNGPIWRGSIGSKITYMPSRLVVQPTNTPMIGSSHHGWAKWSMIATGIPNRNPNRKPKLTISRSSRLPMSLKIRLTSAGLALEVVDDHQLRIEQLVDVEADLVGDLVHDVGQLRLDAVVDGLLGPRRDALPQLGLLAAHRAVDDRRDLGLEQRDDVRGHLLRLELLEELRRRAELRDRLVDRDDAHLRRARGDDPLPADPALHDPRDLLELARGSSVESSWRPGIRKPWKRTGLNSMISPVQLISQPIAPGEERDADQLHPVVCAHAPRRLSLPGERASTGGQTLPEPSCSGPPDAGVQWRNAWRTSRRWAGIGPSSDWRNSVCSARCSSSSSAISWVMPARTTIRSTLRSWRFSGKV